MTASVFPATWLAGYIPDLPTPFDEDGEIDLTALTKLCERQIAAGISAIRKELLAGHVVIAQADAQLLATIGK